MKESGAFLNQKIVCSQSFTKYLRQTLLSWALREKLNFCFFRSFWLALKQLWFWQGHWAFVFDSRKFWNFPYFSQDPKIMRLKLFCNRWGNSYISFLLPIIVLRIPFGVKKTWQYQKVSKYYEKDCLENLDLLFIILLTAPIAPESYFNWVLLYLSKKHAKINLNVFQYRFSTSLTDKVAKNSK